MFISESSMRISARFVLAVLLLSTIPIAVGADNAFRGEVTLELPVQEGTDTARQPAVYDLSLHHPQALKLLLGRLDQLAQQPNPQVQTARIALVLHGPELDYFSIRNYAMHRELVDLAAKLDAFQIIEIKACDTKLRGLGMHPDDLPAFIEIVPYGPGEVRCLVGSGYLKM